MAHVQPQAHDARRAAARRTAWVVGGVVVLIYALFWLGGIARA
jgi:hypothetical protein